ncbi:MAG: dephospho-CoA kinase [Clostridia bacterium]|nr:dephospho-CoA kinase [Clostridia bacterium]
MKTLKVAITGGIGSGKTSVLEILKDKGYRTFNCDESANKALKDRAVIKKIRKQFPFAVKGLLFPKIDKKALAERVFSDENARKHLEMITHPYIVNDVIKCAERVGGVSFIEVPLLFEGGYQNLFDKTIVVVRDKEERIKSVIERSNLSREETLARMRAQVDYDKLDLSPYLVIENTGNKQKLDQMVEVCLKSLQVE